DDLLENYEKYEKEIDRCVDNCISILKILENEYSMYDNNIEDYVKTEHFQNTIFIIDNITKHIYNITHFCY
ncbi:MAG: hypothetical protein J6574_03865, partial [Gilliamella sp.]|nr:hypothetical protein [Gilliamella sp.]